MEEKKVYCSLDIETSGFDPLTEDILEVGFCFFEVNSKGVKILEEYTQVFKPSKEVSVKILGLTGITKTELENAPSFSDHKEFLQEKLGNAVIVGHNIVFDLRFLESVGLKFYGGYVDTLDLVQWVLPTHHSYNLENLMHYFGIPHEDAHRALADSKAALKVLEQLLFIFNSYNLETQNKIKKVINQSNFLWKEWFDIDFQTKKSHIAKNVKIKKSFKAKSGVVSIKSNKIYNFPVFYDFENDIKNSLFGNKEKTLLVVSKNNFVMDLWKEGVFTPVFLPENTFDKQKFDKFLKKKNKSDEEIKFLLKVLVWFETNWQTESLLDLNLSFFGGQYKEMISKNEIVFKSSIKNLICDYQVFLENVNSGLFKKYKVVFLGLSEFEQALSSGIGQKVSWGFVNYVLKGIYNPETNTGSMEHKDIVLEMLSATDLFFGLSCALLKTKNEGFEYFKVNENTKYSENFVKLQKASVAYIEKLKHTATVLNSESLQKTAGNLEGFFLEEENKVKWLELAETRCVFFSNPLNLKDLTQEIFKNCLKIVFVDNLPVNSVLDMFIKRLGLESLDIEQVVIKKTNNILQQDLFSFLSGKNISTECVFVENTIDEHLVLDFCKKPKLPLAVLFPSPLMVKNFYENNFDSLGKNINLLTQNQSGGSNKIFRNFSIYKESALLVTDRFVLKYIEGVANGLGNLSVKTLVIGRIPFEQYTHPYLEAVASSFENSFEQFSLPRAILNLVRIISFFYSAELKQVIFVDAKLQKPYSKAVKDIFINNKNFHIKFNA